MKRTTPLLAALAALLLSAGCASELSGSTYSRDGARAQQAVYHGTLTRVEQVKIEGTDGTLGGIGGAVAGAAIGSTMGGGRGHTVGGALGGIAPSPAPRSRRAPPARTTASSSP